LRRRTPKERIRLALVLVVPVGIMLDGAFIWCVVYLRRNPLVVVAVLAVAFVAALLDLARLVRRYR
jgi:hypothetical protein